jgi:hypothetical protein
MATWDEERAWKIINTAFEEITAGKRGSVDEFSCAKDLVELLGSVRAETIGWTWTEACSQHDRGMDVRRQEIPALLEKARADLNPERK